MRPSGVVWPPALRRKLGIRDDPPKSSASSSSESSTEVTPPPSYYTNSSAHPTSHSDRTFTSRQLRKYIHDSYAAMSSLQRQLHRGEENYFEETYSHGNLFSGFDAIWIDAGHGSTSGGNATNANGGVESMDRGGGMGDGTSAGTGMEMGNSTGGSKSAPARKMPSDYRWFSTSCGSVIPTGDGRIVVLERSSLLDPPPEPVVDFAVDSKNLASKVILTKSRTTITKDAKLKNAPTQMQSHASIKVTKQISAAPSHKKQQDSLSKLQNIKPEPITSSKSINNKQPTDAKIQLPPQKTNSSTSATGISTATTPAKESTIEAPSRPIATLSAPIPKKSASSSSTSGGLPKRNAATTTTTTQQTQQYAQPTTVKPAQPFQPVVPTSVSSSLPDSAVLRGMEMKIPPLKISQSAPPPSNNNNEQLEPEDSGKEGGRCESPTPSSKTSTPSAETPSSERRSSARSNKKRKAS